MELEAANSVQQLDFSLMALFIRATLTVKIVMVILLVSSVWSWSIIIQKFFDYARAKSCLLYTSPSPRDRQKSRMPSSA